MNPRKAFTLTELMVVVILIGIIAAFALPNYQKSIRKAHERDAVVQLMAIHAACKIYNAQTGHYLEGSLDIKGINEQLGLNVIENGMDYTYSSTTPDEFYATAQWPGDDSFTIYIDQRPIEKDTNPCCSKYHGDCPSLPECGLVELPG